VVILVNAPATMSPDVIPPTMPLFDERLDCVTPFQRLSWAYRGGKAALPTRATSYSAIGCRATLLQRIGSGKGQASPRLLEDAE